MKLKPTHPGGQAEESGRGNPPAWLPWLLWGVAIAMVALAVFVMVAHPVIGAPIQASAASGGAQPVKTQEIPSIPAGSGMVAGLPDYAPDSPDSLSRAANGHTTIPQRPSVEPTSYIVSTGDSVFGLAVQFKISPESVLWANYTVLKDNPDLLSLGQQLTIPPTNGVLYKWKDGDTINSIASQYKAKAQDILLWPGNNLDLLNPVITPGTLVMIPGGRREIQQTWVVPTIPRGPAGVLSTIAGTCNTGAGGAYGTGQFMWPTTSHYISGNDYWSGHLAIDIGATLGLPVAAADSGVVVFSGWNPNGYGNMVMIDHGNGFQTLYSHLSALFVTCGQSVYKGTTIGAAGSTGNSTGPHLHFEIRLMGGFVNPHAYLPPG